jgi:hypothetical protein
MYRRTVDELREVAAIWWPEEISQAEARLSIIPLLLQSQEAFLSLLSVEPENLDSFFDILTASALPSNLFLKHLVVLSDFGGEMLKRVQMQFDALFPKSCLVYFWKGEQVEYKFQALPKQGFSNTSLHIDGKALTENHPLDDLKRDAIALLLFGSTHIADQPEADEDGAEETLFGPLARCQVGPMLGRGDELSTFVRQRYIWVSRITGGAQANSLGQLAQKYIHKHLEQTLDLDALTVRSNGTVPGVTHRDETGRSTTFDLVVERHGRFVALEVSFQVTTNSVIERKAGQAKDRYEQIREAGHHIAYVLDGAGNFERKAALTTICEYSDCTAAFTKSELDKLTEFITEVLAG